MKHFKRRFAALLATLMLTSTFCGLAAPIGAVPAEFRIDASDLDVIEQELSISLYHREDGLFHMESVRSYPCKVNRVTQDASFFIQANGDGVWVTVDYLTDLNGDGVYEFLVDDSAPLWDRMDTQMGLIEQRGDDISFLSDGQTYILSAEDLLARSRQAVQNRSSDGPYSLNLAQSAPSVKQFPLCMIQIHCADSAGGPDHVQTYYLQLYGNVLIPTDVSPADWYYEAVEYALEQGYFSGTDDGNFLPDQPLTRAQMAQVLWTMGGCQQAPAAQFFDVSPSSWFYPAVAWCKQEGIIAGYTSYLFAPNDPLSWEQMITILHRYAQYTNSSMRANANLSDFSDYNDISSWAIDSMRWAITHKLIPPTADALRPTATVSRAELAAVLYAYELNLSLYR